MKTARKILCLALVLVMALGMVQLVTAVKLDDYSDKDKIKYQEAVAVLTGIGVLEGTQGAFRPTDNITRAEAAAILTRMLLTRKTADNLPVTSTGFPDVAMTHWAAKYVAFCSSQKIIVGRSDGKFYPNDNVTAVEFAVMLMRALGIGDASKYVGPGWAMNAIIDAMNFKLLNTDVDYTKAATREEVAAYAFEGLKYTEDDKAIQYVWGPTGEYEKVTIDGMTTIVPKYGWIAQLQAGKDSVWYLKYYDNGKGLIYELNDNDDCGRPAKSWTFKKDQIWLNISEPVATFSKGISQNDLYRATGVGGTAAATITAYVNQADAATITSLISNRNATASANAAVYDPYGGNGVITEIYKIGSGNAAKDFLAVIIRPSFGTVTITATKATASKGAFNTYVVGASTGDVFTSHVDADFEDDTAILGGTIANKDSVLYYKSIIGNNLYLDVPGVKTGVVSSVSSSNVITIDGKTTGYARAAGTFVVAPDKEKQDLYVDEFGYVLGAKAGAAPAVRLAFVLSFDQYAELVDGKIKWSYTADIVDLAGKVSTVSTTQTMFNNGSSWVKKLNAFTIANGLYTFSAPSATATDYKVDTGITAITNKASLLTGGVDVTNASSATIFAYVNFKDDGAGNRIPDGTVTLYNGFSAVPSHSALLPGQITGVDLKGTAANFNKVANIVYICNDALAVTTSQFVYVTGAYSVTTTGVVMEVIINGESDTINVKDKATALSITKGLYSMLKIKGDGSVDTATLATPTSLGAGTFQNIGTLLAFNNVLSGFTAADNVPVYTFIVPAAGPVTVTTGVASDLEEAVTLKAGDAVYLSTSTATPSVVNAIFIVQIP